MKIYMAARYSRREEMHLYAAVLTGEGHQVTSRWILGTHEAADDDTRRWAEFWQDDCDDIDRSDTLILFTERGAVPRNTRMVEFGRAQGRAGMRLVVVGPVENPACAAPGVLQFDTWGEFVQSIIDATEGGQ